MNVTVVYGTERHGCTYNIAQQLIHELGDVVLTEITLPRDLPEFCTSCLRCFNDEMGTCSHSHYTEAIRKNLLEADLIILTSPVYAYHVSGQMKVFLDHFANMWMVHRPEKEMFTKQGVVIATASGPVFKKSLNEMKDSLDFWGVSRTLKLGQAVFETTWSDVSDKTKMKIEQKVKNIARDINKKHGSTRPNLRVKKWFYISRLMHKKMGFHKPDVDYWQKQGWLDRKRPWKHMK